MFIVSDVCNACNKICMQQNMHATKYACNKIDENDISDSRIIINFSFRVITSHASFLYWCDNVFEQPLSLNKSFSRTETFNRAEEQTTRITCCHTTWPNTFLTGWKVLEFYWMPPPPQPSRYESFLQCQIIIGPTTVQCAVFIDSSVEVDSLHTKTRSHTALNLPNNLH